MELDIKNLKQQDMGELVHSLELVSARVLDSIVRTGQTACAATPEMQRLFEQWVEMIGGALVDEVKRSGSIDPEKAARTIGVTPDTILSLALTLHRQGKIKITGLTSSVADGSNREICGCLKG